MPKSLVVPSSKIKELAATVPTPFHLYDAFAIRERINMMKNAFGALPGFQNYFAVKALPNPYILDLVKSEDFGVDCSSLAELCLAEAVGFRGENIMFTSNCTPLSEFEKAKSLGAIINLDDISHISFLHEKLGLPNLISCRYNPGSQNFGNEIIGTPASAKFGMTKEQLIRSYIQLKSLGVQRFGLHTMIVSNSRNQNDLCEIATSMFQLIVELKNNHGINIEFVNLGGGFGIPYDPHEEELDINELGKRVLAVHSRLLGSVDMSHVKVNYECGRFITGPCGVLVSRVIHQKKTYKNYLGIDACINSLMRPALYGSYHHITMIHDNTNRPNLPSNRTIFTDNEENAETLPFDVIGSLCENNDKLAIDRFLPANTSIGDLLVFHDTGAHGHCMGFNYNGKLRVAEYLNLDIKSSEIFKSIISHKISLSDNSSILRIRRAESLSDLFATIEWSSLKSLEE